MNASRPEKPNRKLVLSKETVRVLNDAAAKPTQGEARPATPSTKQTQGASCKS
jgi:hypothetical protein